MKRWLAIFLSLGLLNNGKTQLLEKSHFWRQSELNDVHFTDGLLWTKDVASKMQCSRMCAGNTACVSFTFTTSVSLKKSCRAHSSVMSSRNVTVSTPGSKYYVKWLRMPCTSTDQCPAHNSECFSGRCLCTPGYFYSESSGVCVATCSRLGNDYVEYPQSKMVVNPVFSFDIASMEECAQKCLEYGPLFPTFDYRFLIQVCNLFNVTALTADPGDFQIITNNVYTWSHFQRTCQ